MDFDRERRKAGRKRADLKVGQYKLQEKRAGHPKVGQDTRRRRRRRERADLKVGQYKLQEKRAGHRKVTATAAGDRRVWHGCAGERVAIDWGVNIPT